MAIHWEHSYTTFSDFSKIPSLRKVGLSTQTSPTYKHGLGWLAKLAPQNLPPHWDYATIQLTLSGTGKLTHNGKAHSLPAGTGFIGHTTGKDIKWSYPEEATEPWKFLYVEIFGENMKSFVSEVYEKFGPVFNFDTSANEISQLLDLELLPTKNLNLDHVRQYELINDLLKIVIKGFNYSPPKQPHILKQALKEIEQNIKNPLSVEEIAKKLQITREYLSRCFTKHLGVSPHQYIINQKMNEAAILLKHQTHTVSEIADMYGFSSPTLFGRIFKKQFGITPSQFRSL